MVAGRSHRGNRRHHAGDAVAFNGGRRRKVAEPGSHPAVSCRIRCVLSWPPENERERSNRATETRGDRRRAAAHPAMRLSATTRGRRSRSRRVDAPVTSRSEDFLFHLYRGSELLQENRVLEAKESSSSRSRCSRPTRRVRICSAPSTSASGTTRARSRSTRPLEMGCPNDASIKVNLALAYLKTGQPEPARRALLEARASTRSTGARGATWASRTRSSGSSSRRRSRRARRPPDDGPAGDRAATAHAAAPDTAAGIVDAACDGRGDGVSELEAGELRFALAEAEPARRRTGRGTRRSQATRRPPAE